MFEGRLEHDAAHHGRVCKDERRKWIVKEHARNPRCFYCRNITIMSWLRHNLSGLHATVDHYIPRAKGGANNPKNYRLACFTCNQLKADMDAADFIAELREAGVRD